MSAEESESLVFKSRKNDHLLVPAPVYPRVKVRVQEEKEDHFPPPNGNESSLFLRLNESISKQEKENQINSPPSNSISRVAKAYVSSAAASKCVSSASKAKNDKQIGKDNNTKSNVKARSVPPPRAVLSSPDNDGMIGSRNKLNYTRSATALKRRPAEQVKPAGQAQKNLYPSHNVTRSSPNIGKGGPKIENVNLSPNMARSSPKIRKGPKTENRGFAAGSIRADPLKQV